jgi:hypothetical protein
VRSAEEEEELVADEAMPLVLMLVVGPVAVAVAKNNHKSEKNKNKNKNKNKTKNKRDGMYVAYDVWSTKFLLLLLLFLFPMCLLPLFL